MRLLVRPSTRQHVWPSLPDPTACATGDWHNRDALSLPCHAKGWPSVRVVLRPAGKARRESHQLRDWVERRHPRNPYTSFHHRLAQFDKW